MVSTKLEQGDRIEIERPAETGTYIGHTEGGALVYRNDRDEVCTRQPSQIKEIKIIARAPNA